MRFSALCNRLMDFVAVVLCCALLVGTGLVTGYLYSLMEI
jgi:hypothetical protein